MTTWSYQSSRGLKIEISRYGIDLSKFGSSMHETLEPDEPVDPALIAGALKIISIAKERNPEMFKANFDLLTKAGNEYVYGR